MIQHKPLVVTSHKDFKNDFQTPVPVAKYMVSLLPDGVKNVLEPTPGIGNIMNELIDKGYDVTAPDDYFINGGGQI
jgi:hypothetical protein